MRAFSAKKVILLTTTLLTAVAVSANATEAEQIKKALVEDAKPYIDVRYRFENVDQEGFAKDANASTVRTKLGYKTGSYHDVSAVLEFENVTLVGNDHYNDTINGKTSLPTVADPESTEVNQAYLTYSGLPDTTIKLGRQGVNLDNQRFVGTVGFRQNDQTYDSVVLANTSIPNTTLVYGFVDNVNRVFSDDHPNGNLGTQTHLVNASYSGFDFGKFTGYGYLIDLDKISLSNLSSKTFGLRFDGSYNCTHIDGVKWLYTAEYANQSDHGDNTTNYNADYYTLEGGAAYKGFTAKAGFEFLGSDNNGTVSFQTPLATGHKFNGWADKFLTTPVAGLEDVYGLVKYKFSDINEVVNDTEILVAYHDFSAENGGADYGTEWNAQISRSFMEHYNVAVKYADYNAETVSTDTQKLWLTLGAKF